jgi:type IX secretion system PorP/SprF family membrane protein
MSYKLNKYIIINVLCLLISTSFSNAQDPLFSQFYYNPLYLNPANAGSVNMPRLYLSYRNQWPALGSTFVTFQGSYDQYIKSIKGGLGINVIRDNIADGTINSTKVDVIYSHRYKLSEKYTMQAGLQATFNFFGVNIESLNPQFSNYSTTQFDVGIGALFYSRFSQWGLSVDHLNTGYLKINPTFLPSPIKVSLFYSRNIKISNSQKLNSSEFILSPAVLVQYQGNSFYANYGLGIRHSILMAGIFARTNIPLQMTNAIFALGVSLGDNWKLGYSYDYNILSLNNKMPITGAHEVTLIATFPPDPTKERYGAVPCPKFVGEY